MRFEQPGKLNVLVDGRRDRRSKFKEVLPIVIYCAVCGGGVAAGTNWMRGVQSNVLWTRTLAATVGLATLALVIVPVSKWIYLRSKRTLSLEDERVRASHDERVLNVQWESIRQFEIEPISARHDLAKISITVELGKRALLSRFSMVLDRATQVPALLDELRRRSETNSFKVIESSNVFPLSRRPIRGLWAAMAGMLFLTIGLPLLLTVIFGGRSERERPVTRPPVQFERFIKRHFSSVAELQRAFVVTGTVATAIGASLYGWGIRLLNQRKRLIQIDMRSHMEQIREDPGCRILIS